MVVLLLLRETARAPLTLWYFHFQFFYENCKLTLKMNIDEWIEVQKKRLVENSEVEGPLGCMICKLGGFRRQYSVLSVKFPWEEHKLTVSGHRFAFMLHYKKFDLSKNVHVSHLCHNCRCVNPEHLSYEPDHVNKDRQVCRGTVPLHCRKHEPYEDCLF